MEQPLNLTGLFCPEPIMMLRSTVRKAEKGTVIRVTTTDPATERDIPDFCRFMEHQLLDQQTQEIPFTFLIKVGLD